MIEVLRALDLSRIENVASGDATDRWLGELQKHLTASEHVIRLGETQDNDDEDWVISRDRFGNWQTGRYIGEVTFKGRRLAIAPRLGSQAISRWLEGAMNLVAVPETSQRDQDAPLIALLMAAVWCRAVDVASRHGPPAFRRDIEHTGHFVRGRLDVRRTLRLRRGGSDQVASVLRQRDTSNDVARTLVAAERVLKQAIGNDRWRTARVRELMPHLHAAVGARPALPTQRDLRQIRYTPITRPFKQAAELSWRIARQEGFGAQAEPGEAEGLLLDVAELWELYLLAQLRQALPGLKVIHGTNFGDRTFLLAPAAGDHPGMGRLKPDFLVYEDERLVAVLDAKYKRLRDWWPERPYGVDRGDLYQLTSYLARHDPAGRCAGLLLYPGENRPRALEEPELAGEASTAESAGPWRLESGSQVRFERVPVEPEAAGPFLRELIDATRRTSLDEAGRRV